MNIINELLKSNLSVALGDPCPQPAQLNASVLYPCTNATKLNYFDGYKAGFGIFIIVLFLFPVGQYHTHKSISFCTEIMLISLISSLISFDCFIFTVSFLVACMVAYLRKYRYRKFQRRRKAGAKTEEPAVGITGMNQSISTLFA